ncbi:MAG: FAD-dependent oxidoreductase [Candidatus Marithrix sp.]|nr:FAD-dependent oxidoreductase [Candidatus Marithrix sp.]
MNYHNPRTQPNNTQDLMPGQYSLTIKLLSMALFTLAFVGWFNETWLFWFNNPIWLNRYTEYAIVLGFGIWRIAAERNYYTRKRLIILVFVVTIFWWLIPWLYPVYEPYVGFLWGQPVFPALHVPGTVTFFLILGLVFLFGRRVICGFGCPCVGIRETVGFPFRKNTLRSKWTWRLRHSKWLFFIYYVGIMVVTQFPPNSWTVSFVGGFYLIVAFTYFGTFFIAPLVGNRSYCRYLCPYGATFGILNHAGFYGINMDTDKCIDCRRCEQVCDMGIPVWEQGKQAERVTAIEDCMGCARCVVSCPTDALEIRDVRNLFKKSLVQNASYLMKSPTKTVINRQEPDNRPIIERLDDWKEITQIPTLAQIQTQAARCLDCGVPGCMNACPLSNRIPEWLEKVVVGDIKMAANIAQSTSNLPEICGRLCPQSRLCEGSCTKAKETDGAITIGAIEHFLVDEAFKQGWQPKITCKNNGKSIAIIGAGPAGLACADQLCKAGCQVTVYDKQPVIGGLLATAVPSFKLDKKLLTHRHYLLQQQGIDFQLNIEVDELLIQQLVNTNDAIFLATGIHTSRNLKLPGQTLAGVTDALNYLEKINLNPVKNDPIFGKQVLVIGGGDSAIDCARSAVRQMADKVTIIYRGDKQAMRASPKEQKIAREEGIEFLFNHSPVAIKGNDKVTGVHFNKPDGSTEIINCNQVIFAVGQVAKPPIWFSKLGIITDSKGLIQIDKNGQTSHSKIFAGGDNTNGSDLVVTAIASGRLAADGLRKVIIG